MSDAEPAEKNFGAYERIRLLTRGRSAEVYEARHCLLNRRVALKILSVPARAEDPIWKRFEREAKAAASLIHPNVVRIYDFGQEGGFWFVAMEFLEGETLESRLQRGPLTVPEALEKVTQIAEGLKVAQEKKIVHRDLKPANLFITSDNTLKILDFGLAKVLEGENLTLEGELLGTPSYMAPEQTGLLSGVPVDGRADLFSLGVVWFEMLTGKKAFSSGQVMKTLQQVAFQEPLWNSVPEDLSKNILRKCLEKLPEARYAFPSELLTDLDKYRSGTFIPEKKPRHLWAEFQKIRRKLPVFWMFLGLFLCIGIMAWVWQQRRFESREWILQGEEREGGTLEKAGWREDSDASRDGKKGEQSALSPWKVEKDLLRVWALEPSRLRWQRPVMGDLRLECDLETASSYVPTLTFFFRKETSQNGVAFRISGRISESSALLKIPEGSVLDSNSGFRLEPSSKYHLEITRNQSHFLLKVNGRVILEAEDFLPPLAPGQEWIFLQAERGFAGIRNFKCFKLSTPLKSNAFLTAEKWAARGLLREAEEEYRDLAEQFKSSEVGFEAAFRRGVLLLKLRRVREAKSVFQDLEDRCPDEPTRARLFFHLGVCLMELGQQEQGEKIFLETLQKLSPQNSEWISNLIAVYTDRLFSLTNRIVSQDASEQSRTLLRILKILDFLSLHFPKHTRYYAEPFAGSGFSVSKFLSPEDYEDFRLMFEKVFPEERALIAKLYLREGEELLCRKQTGRAVEKFRHVLEHFPEERFACAESHLLLGHVFLTEGFHQEARQKYETVMNSFSGEIRLFGEAWLFLGESFRLAGNGKKAEALWQELFFDPRFQSTSELSLAVKILNAPNLESLRSFNDWKRVSESSYCQYFLGVRFEEEQKLGEAGGYYRRSAEMSRDVFFPASLSTLRLNALEKKTVPP